MIMIIIGGGAATSTDQFFFWPNLLEYSDGGGRVVISQVDHLDWLLATEREKKLDGGGTYFPVWWRVGT